MASSHTTQITIDPEEYRQLEALAHQKGVSVAELFQRRDIVREIFRLEVPIEEDWNSVEEEIACAHGDGLP